MHMLPHAVLALGVCGLLVGCGGSQPPSPPLPDAGGLVDGGNPPSTDGGPDGGADAGSPRRLGESCVQNVECASGWCDEFALGKACAARCDDASACPPGTLCTVRGTPKTCVPELARATGQTCRFDEECDARLCADRVCAQPCGRLFDPPCPQGLACAVAAAKPFCALRGAAAFNTPCSADTDCTSLVCAPGPGGGRVCSQLCERGGLQGDGGSSGDGGARCPAGFSCFDRSDSPFCAVAGARIFGQSCTSDFDCTSLACLSGTQQANQTCTQSCTRDADCPAGYKCPNRSPGTDYCMPPGNAAFGGACRSDAECVALVCITRPTDPTGTCSQPCDAALACPQGYHCPNLVDGLDACLARGTKTFGRACENPLDCFTGRCQVAHGGESFCSDTCEPSSSGACPSGYQCTNLFGALSENRCLRPGPLSFGSECASGLNCASLACVQSERRLVCSTPCSSSAPCPSGYGCLAGLAHCVPRGSTALGGACTQAVQCESLDCRALGSTTPRVCTKPCSTSDASSCPSGFECRISGGAAACRARGPKALGAACSDDGECDSLECVLLSDRPGQRVCSRTCGGSAGDVCPADFLCRRQNSGRNQCVLRGQKTAGETCSANNECSDFSCHEFTFPCGDGRISALGSRCSLPCNPGACASGQRCEGFPGNQYWCLPLGTQALGSECAFDSQCGAAPNSCAGVTCDPGPSPALRGACSQPCDPVALSGCPTGFVCVGESVGARCYVAGPMPTGSTGCTANGQCAGGICFEGNSAAAVPAYCSASCRRGMPADCPSSTACIPVSSTLAYCVLRGTQTFGQPCAAYESCATAVCVGFQAGARCTRLCSGNADCSGLGAQSCVPTVSGFSVCQP